MCSVGKNFCYRKSCWDVDANKWKSGESVEKTL